MGAKTTKRDTKNIKNTNDVSQEINTYCYTVHSGSRILFTVLELCFFNLDLGWYLKDKYFSASYRKRKIRFHIL